MADLPPPSIDTDGSHVIPVSEIHRPDQASDTQSHGEVRWNQREGLTFRLEFPMDLEEALAGLQTRNREPGGRVGSVQALTFAPEWIARTGEGGLVRLFGTIPGTKTEITTKNGARLSRRIVSGAAAYAEVELARANPLSFWYDTVLDHRLFFLGLQLSRWPQAEEITYRIGDADCRRSRCSLPLSRESPLALFRAGELPEGMDGAWVSYRSKHAHPFWYDRECEAVRGLVSLLVGRWTPFLWRDAFVNEEQVSRLYFGWHRSAHPPVGSEQPVPLGRTVEALGHGQEVAERIPELYTSFAAIRAEYNLEWVLTPLWAAGDTFVDEKLALACVCLERLATVHDDMRKARNPNSRRASLLSPEQLQAVRKALKSILRNVADSVEISEDAIRILEKRLDNIHQTPNADKLAQVFADLGIELTEEERRVLDNRNRCMHGRATLADGADTAAINAELHRFDVLRTLLHRAILSVLNYDGPYVDYGARPATGNFPIRMLAPQARETNTNEE